MKKKSTKKQPVMSQREKDFLFWKADGEGADYLWRHYSDWKEIKDKKFHELRKAYIKAAEALDKYVGLDRRHDEVGHEEDYIEDNDAMTKD